MSAHGRADGDPLPDPVSHGAVGRLKSDIEALRRELDAAARTIAEGDGRVVQPTASLVRLNATHARLDTTLAELRACRSRFAKALGQQVQARPIASMLLAAVLGFALAQVMARR